ncbi:hypothetical protein LI276_22630, partial [[Clostridium] scindens]|uniref:hypothetical protein n=1 Tax=Clostridium scindens (strain JCM 10418 / VPI 12708) TaxID=29347 RepID=UPI001D0884BB
KGRINTGRSIQKKQCTLPCAVYKVPGQVAIVLVCLIAGPSHKMNNIADTFLAHKKKREFHTIS